MSGIDDLRKKASDVFSVRLRIPDLLVAISSGILVGLGNALFKGFVPKHGQFKHYYGTRRVPIDNSIPKPKGFHGSVNNLYTAWTWT